MFASGVARTGTAVAAVVAAATLTGGAGAVAFGRGPDPAPSGRTSVSSVGPSHHGADVTRMVTSVWRPR